MVNMLEFRINLSNEPTNLSQSNPIFSCPQNEYKMTVTLLALKERSCSMTTTCANRISSIGSLSIIPIFLVFVVVAEAVQSFNTPLACRRHETKIRLQSSSLLLLRMASSSFPASSMEDNNRSSRVGDDKVMIKPNKKILFIRHGRTYMNEHIGGENGVGYGSPGFTDLFDEKKTDQDDDDSSKNDKSKFYDSPLSVVGIQQAKEMRRSIEDLLFVVANGDDSNINNNNNGDDGESQGTSSPSLLDPSIGNFISNDLDLVVVSPLTRALQTLHIGLYPHLLKRTNGYGDDGDGSGGDGDGDSTIPILATPKVSERIYLISDLGTKRTKLKQLYPYVDFETAFDPSQSLEDSWHYIPTDEDIEEYVEWRPHGQGQVYACLGEPQHHFDKRMSELYYLLDRPEQSIAVVCHAGVLEWFTQKIFRNCEIQLWNFDDLTPTNLVPVDEKERNALYRKRTDW